MQSPETSTKSPQKNKTIFLLIGIFFIITATVSGYFNSKTGFFLSLFGIVITGCTKMYQARKQKT